MFDRQGIKQHSVRHMINAIIVPQGNRVEDWALSEFKEKYNGVDVQKPDFDGFLS